MTAEPRAATNKYRMRVERGRVKRRRIPRPRTRWRMRFSLLAEKEGLLLLI
jgi:hypothetical protein